MTDRASFLVRILSLGLLVVTGICYLSWFAGDFVGSPGRWCLAAAATLIAVFMLEPRLWVGVTVAAGWFALQPGFIFIAPPLHTSTQLGELVTLPCAAALAGLLLIIVREPPGVRRRVWIGLCGVALIAHGFYEAGSLSDQPMAAWDTLERGFRIGLLGLGVLGCLTVFAAIDRNVIHARRLAILALVVWFASLLGWIVPDLSDWIVEEADADWIPETARLTRTLTIVGLQTVGWLIILGRKPR